MVDTTEAKDRLNRAVEVEVGADGETPVSPNNPPAKAVYVDRNNLETPDKDESKGGDRDGVVSPNNPPEKTHTVSEDAPGGHVPEGVSEAVVEAAANEWYPASYNPVKEDTDENGQPIANDVVVPDEGDEDEADEPDEKEDPVEEAAAKEQEPAAVPAKKAAPKDKDA